MGGAPRGHAAPPRLRAVARERAGRRPPGRHRRPAAARRRPGGGAHVRARAVGVGRRLRDGGRRGGARATPSTEAGLERVVAIAKPENGGVGAPCSRKLGLRTLGDGRVLGQARGRSTSWPPRDWRAERAAATPPLRTERLELRRFAAADLEPLLDVFGDAEVMRYVGAERRPLDRDAVAASLGGRRRALVGARVRPAGGRRARLRAPGRGGRPAAPGGRPGRRARVHAARAPPGVAATRRRRRAPSCAGRSPACACTASWPSPTRPTRASLHVLDKLGMTRLGMRDCYGAQMVRVGALAGVARARRTGARRAG